MRRAPPAPGCTTPPASSLGMSWPPAYGAVCSNVSVVWCSPLPEEVDADLLGRRRLVRDDIQGRVAEVVRVGRVSSALGVTSPETCRDPKTRGNGSPLSVGFALARDTLGSTRLPTRNGIDRGFSLMLRSAVARRRGGGEAEGLGEAAIIGWVEAFDVSDISARSEPRSWPGSWPAAAFGPPIGPR